MIKAYEAREIADSFDRTKALIENVEKRIKTESQCGKYEAKINWFFELDEDEVVHILGTLQLNGYQVKHIRGLTVIGEVVNTFEIRWGRGDTL